MLKFIANFGHSFSVYRKDKFIILLSLIPVLIGSLLYYFLGSWIYGDLLSRGRGLIDSYLSEGVIANILYYVVGGLLTVALFFIISWTFVLTISLIAAPFNDLISSRVENLLLGKKQDSVKETFLQLFSRYRSVIVNEIKKILTIVTLSLLAFVISFIPLLVPLTVLMSALLLAVEFLDYNWSRRELGLRECLGNVRRMFLSYSLAGLVFLVLITVPFLNLFVFSYGVVYFSVLFVKNFKAEDLQKQ